MRDDGGGFSDGQARKTMDPSGDDDHVDDDDDAVDGSPNDSKTCQRRD